MQWRWGWSMRFCPHVWRMAIEADLDTETLPGKFGERLGRRLEKNVVDDLPVSQGKGIELIRQGEDDMEVLDGEELSSPVPRSTSLS